MRICHAIIDGDERFCVSKDNKLYNIINDIDEIKSNFFSMNLNVDYDKEIEYKNIKYMIPVPYIRSVRDFYSFEDHVKNSRRNRGLDMVKEWYEFPVFYFSCTPNIYPDGAVIPYPRKSKKFDFEMEVAAVIGKKTKNCHGIECLSAVHGFMIMNDWSLRDIQAKEMAVGLGPAKGKDYATSFGRYYVTSDEIIKDGRIDIDMSVYINGKIYSSGNISKIYWPFESMIERASEDVELLPGDVIGSGTFSNGCLLESGSNQWLKPGDVIRMSSYRLGDLENTIGD
ncbi:fumarylacetoacetate hydrolase family protein [Picrophilus oshimae]|uniref:Fumarylacetoacetate hydrolase n=1 Tax=Picrophilus torridus (strain ATCC 700027 / DSM 9790 / JCM 10055 / NBRC 100828 / KAW 2/3) TaxID=1122961 RepID=A0A8G2L7C5_PICTO|nr:fumarylacetoacetate hydrolase family protein [Picrophilus oshimae]SMD30972.1 fumarylacetoacetate hydrolase [Picrophilus oshimae DSM 9789]